MLLFLMTLCSCKRHHDRHRRLATNDQTGYVNTPSGVNVRTGPGTNYAKIGAIAYNKAVTITGSSGNWYIIKYGSSKGYVSKDYITVSSTPTPSGSTGQKILAYAKQKLGCPYVWGATGPNSFDCSGLTQWAHRQAGISIPRVSYDQAKAGRAISRGSEAPGDIVCFCTSGSGVSHVGLYAGSNSFIHAPHSGDVVKITSFSSYYNKAWRTSRRCY